MNREIKFRGQRIDNNELVYGYYVKDPKGHHRIYWKPFEDASSNTYHFVKPETVGQFTGFKDYDGKEFFEGDVISFTAVRDCTQKKKFEIYFNKDCGAWYCKNGQELCNILFEQNNDDWKRSQNWTVRDCQYVRVIGNIHENPELLID
jgi:uncharacterized phage protein (TIGR01671 family)